MYFIKKIRNFLVEKLDLSEKEIRFFNKALRCVALRCVALRCVALRCVAESFCLQMKSSKKRNILGKCE